MNILMEEKNMKLRGGERSKYTALNDHTLLIKLLTIQDPLEVFKLYTVHESKPRPNALMVPSNKEQVPSGSKVISSITAKVVDVTLLIHRRCLLEATTSSPNVHPSLEKGTMNNT
jgi:hypothetical protein